VYGAETQSQLSAIAAAIQEYYNDYKAYPGPLANSQLDYQYDSSINPTPPEIYGPTNTKYQLLPTTPYPASAAGTPSVYNPPVSATYNNVTGAQNLVLGLFGGLELQYNGGTLQNFVYNPQDISADGVNPSPRGPSSLNPASPRKQQAYLNVRAGDLSVPNSSYNSGQGASFADSAGRSPLDAMIPVFLDKYADPLPILYYRTNVGGTAIVGSRNTGKFGTFVNDQDTVLSDPSDTSATPEVPQYDLTQNILYTQSAIGTSTNPKFKNSSGGSYSLHGLMGVTGKSNESAQLLITVQPGQPQPNPPVDPIDYTPPGSSAPTPSNAGANGLAYFKDPSLNSTTYDGITSNVHAGAARQKDGFVLISAGPDRLYGTRDDLINPGPLQP
jgi:hypothetical protein